MKACTDCLWCSTRNGSDPEAETYYTCCRPVFNMVWGETGLYRKCEAERKTRQKDHPYGLDHINCGEQAKFFERRKEGQK